MTSPSGETVPGGRREASDVRAPVGALHADEGAFELLFQSHPLPMWIFAYDTLTFLAVNDAALHAYGYSREQFLAMTLMDIRPVDDQDACREAVRARPGYTETRRIWRHVTADGSLRHIEAYLRPVTFAGRDAALATIVDVTERRQNQSLAEQASQALRASEERLKRALAAARMIAWELDAETGKLSRSSNAQEFLGTGHDGPLSDVHIHPDDLAAYEEAKARSLAGETVVIEYRIQRPDGKFIWVETRAHHLVTAAQTKRVVGVTFNITERKAAEAQLWQQATHDALTGLPNRTLFRERLDGALADAGRNGTRLVLVLLDLDNFKTVNDTLGHDAGDTLLRFAASRLRQAMDQGWVLARLGGDEFGIIIPDMIQGRALDGALTRLQQSLDQSFAYDGQRLAIRTSIGVALYPDHDTSAPDLMKSADLALYAAKAQGRNRRVVFSPDLRSATEQRVMVAGQVRDALGKDEFVPFYQPKVCLQSGAVIGFEALLRWQNPVKGLVAPGAIASAFDDPDLAVRIGRCMLDRIIADVRSWLERSIDFGRIAVNLSSVEFSEGFADTLLQTLSAAGIDCRHLEVEVTEGVFLGSRASKVDQALRTLHQAGITIALDDFGTGFASLSHLKQFPIDSIKIDRSFVSNLKPSGDDSAIVSAVIALGRSLSLDVTAEGVETASQLEILRERQCSHAQGYLFAKPMIGSRVTGFLRSWPQAAAKLWRPTARLSA